MFENFQKHTRHPHQWIEADLIARIGASTRAQFGGIAVFPTTPNNHFHIYSTPSTEANQIHNNGLAWSVEDLTGGAGQADDNSGMAEFFIGNCNMSFP